MPISIDYISGLLESFPYIILTIAVVYFGWWLRSTEIRALKKIIKYFMDKDK